ncbi:AraC family transcriptional regulator [Paenochrobactrum pullorum]|uniref:AraC family transcriptional regulator n=1 Tax=Paenochrobactrum pullorum TaxID=1324351 RepID=UPI0035BC16B0
MKKGRFHLIPCEMKGAEAVLADSSHSFGRHIHDQFGIGIILTGAQKSLSGRGMVEAEAGDVITVNPGEIHDGSPIGDNGRRWQMLYFDPVCLIEPIRAITDCKIDMLELSRPALQDTVSARSFLKLFRAVTDKNGGESEIERRENLLILLSRLMDYRVHDQFILPKAINEARERIDDDPCASLSLDELAKIGGVSQFQLIRGFTKLTGLTPHAYLVQRRLQRARKMIAAGALLADAAYTCGFADQSHMTRIFVRAYGFSPGHYAALIN